MVKLKREVIRKAFHKALFHLCIFLVSFFFVASCHHATNVYTRTENDTMANANGVVVGKPFFTFGFYHVSWDSTAEQRITDLRAIATAGFNTIHASIKNLDDLNNKYENFLDEAERLGVYVISEFGNLNPVTAVNKFKDKPAVFGWNISDDSGIEDSPSCNKILQLHKALKAADPNHVTYISVAAASQHKNYNYCSNIIGAQQYPIPSEREKAHLNDVFYVMDLAHTEAAKFNRSVYANLQSFPWPGWRQPTFKELRNMTYQALLGGVNGIIYYTYYDELWYLPKHQLWQGLKSLVPEIKQLSPILLNGNLKKIDTNLTNAFAGIWTYQNQAVVVVVNTSYNSSKNVSIQLPLNNVRNASSMFPRRPSGMVVKDGKLSGSINPLDVHVYSFSS